MDYKEMCRLSREHRDNPEPGDYWHEMFSPQFLVIAVDDERVSFLEHIKAVDDKHWTWDTSEMTILPRQQFAERVSYSSPNINDKTWCNVSPKHRGWEIFAKDALERCTEGG